MPAITVTFWGICTYIIDRHRFVLVNASSEVISSTPHLADKGIDPHFARLHIRIEDIVSIGPLPIVSTIADGFLRIRLDQVSLSIANPAVPQVLDVQNGCAPHLRDYKGTGELGPAALATPEGGAAIACLFDVAQGVLQGLKRPPGNDSDSGDPAHHGEAVSVLTTETEGDPQLIITPFNGGLSMTITVRSGASVLVSNLPDPDAGGADLPVDFLLNFLVADVVPQDATYPTSSDEYSCPQPGSDQHIENGGIEQYLGPGCSNTNYP